MQRLTAAWSSLPFIKTIKTIKSPIKTSEALTRIRSLGETFRVSLREEHQRYKAYYARLEGSIASRLNGTTSSLKQNLYMLRGLAAYHLKHTPIYLFKVGVYGSRFGWQVVKIVGRTKPGGALITCVVLYYGAQPIYVYGTRRTKEVTVTKVFQRNDYSETDGLTGYLFTDEHGNNYRVVGSWFYAQFFPVELWTAIEVGKPYKITCYGIRFPPLKIWPNVVRMYPLNHKGDYHKEIEARNQKRREIVNQVYETSKKVCARAVEAWKDL